MHKLLLSAAILLLGCGTATRPCTSPEACSRSQECVANRCAERGSDPALHATERVVLEPVVAGVVTQNGREAGLPAAVTFGSRALGRTTLFLAFPFDNARHRSIVSAFVLLDPAPATAVDRQEVQVEAWRVQAAWQPASLDWSSQPGLGLPKGIGIVSATPRQTLRIDVTELIRYLDDEAPPDRNHGLALTAAPGDGHGASFATGSGPGRAPRLEIYLR